MDITLILTRRFPGVWTLNGDNYDGLEWLSDTPKPTLEEIESQWSSVKAEIAQEKADAEAKRQALLAKLGITEEEARLLLGGI